MSTSLETAWFRFDLLEYVSCNTFDEDRFAEICNSDNIYYPFAGEPEWELAEFLLTSGLSMAAIDLFLSLPLVSCVSLRMLDPLGLIYVRSDKVTPALLSDCLTAMWPC